MYIGVFSCQFVATARKQARPFDPTGLTRRRFAAIRAVLYDARTYLSCGTVAGGVRFWHVALRLAFKPVPSREGNFPELATVRRRAISKIEILPQ